MHFYIYYLIFELLTSLLIVELRKIITMNCMLYCIGVDEWTERPSTENIHNNKYARHMCQIM